MEELRSTRESNQMEDEKSDGALGERAERYVRVLGAASGFAVFFQKQVRF